MRSAPLTGTDATRSSAGWQSWDLPQDGDYGLVYIVPSGQFGYYDDGEGASGVHRLPRPAHVRSRIHLSPS